MHWPAEPVVDGVRLECGDERGVDDRLGFTGDVSVGVGVVVSEAPVVTGGAEAGAAEEIAAGPQR